MSHITNFKVKFHGSGEVAGVRLLEVLVMRLPLKNHLQDQNTSPPDKYHKHHTGLCECLLWPRHSHPYVHPAPWYLCWLSESTDIDCSHHLVSLSNSPHPLLWHPLVRHYLPEDTWQLQVWVPQACWSKCLETPPQCSVAAQGLKNGHR